MLLKHKTLTIMITSMLGIFLSTYAADAGDLFPSDDEDSAHSFEGFREKRALYAALQKTTEEAGHSRATLPLQFDADACLWYYPDKTASPAIQVETKPLTKSDEEKQKP